MLYRRHHSAATKLSSTYSTYSKAHNTRAFRNFIIKFYEENVINKEYWVWCPYPIFLLHQKVFTVITTWLLVILPTPTPLPIFKLVVDDYNKTHSCYICYILQFEQFYTVVCPLSILLIYCSLKIYSFAFIYSYI